MIEHWAINYSVYWTDQCQKKAKREKSEITNTNLDVCQNKWPSHVFLHLMPNVNLSMNTRDSFQLKTGNAPLDLRNIPKIYIKSSKTICFFSLRMRHPELVTSVLDNARETRYVSQTFFFLPRKQNTENSSVSVSLPPPLLLPHNTKWQVEKKTHHVSPTQSGGRINDTLHVGCF